MKLDDMLQGFSAQTRFAAEVVVNVGVRAQELWFWDKANVSHSIRAKLQLGSDHLAGLADYQGQRYTLERFASLFPKVRFFAEESTNGLPNRLRSMVINRSKLHKLPQEFRTIDPVDGSVDYYSGGAEWCVGSAGWKDGRFTDGVAFAPDLKGGLVCVGEKGKGCKVGRVRKGEEFLFVSEAAVKELNQHIIPIVHYGNTMVKDKKFLDFLHAISQDSFATTKSVGSTTLELVKVACGDVDGFVHTLNDIDSVAPGIVPLQLAGAVYEFFGWDDKGNLEFFSTPGTGCFQRACMGVCAGTPIMFARLKAALVQHWPSKNKRSLAFFAKAGS